MPNNPECDFPSLRIPSDDHVIKSIKASIEGDSGEFYGIVRKSSGLPDGFGVFVTSDGWIHCCKVKDGLFQEGRHVSANKYARILMLTNKKFLIDGSILFKIEVFSDSGARYDFLKDGKKSADFNARINLCKDHKNWLSMQPNPLKYAERLEEGFGEVNYYNALHGRGIRIWGSANIDLRYWEYGFETIGNYIYIERYGDFRVGELYLNDGRICDRGTWYYRNGTEETYDK